LAAGTVLTIDIYSNPDFTGLHHSISATVQADGSWSTVTTSNLSNNNTYYFRVTPPLNTADAAGNLVKNVEFTRLASNSIGNTAFVINVKPLTGDNFITESEISPNLTIVGETSRTSSTVTVRVYQNNILLYTKTTTSGATYTAGTNNWSLTLSTAEVQAMANGQFLVVASVADGSITISDAELPVLELNAPTLTITDPIPGTLVGGSVTFTLTFSEGVTGLEVGEVVISAGSKGDFTAVSAAIYTLVVTPPADASGTITVTVANNVANGVNTGRGNVGATHDQDYNTTAAAQPPDITIATGDLAGNPLPTITGTTSLLAGAPILVEIDMDNDGVVDLVYSVTVQPGGTWSLDIGTAAPVSGDLPEAGLPPWSRIVATATNGYGASASATGLNTPLVNAQVTNDPTPAITGSWTQVAGDVLEVTVNGITYVAGDGNLVADATSWTLTIPPGDALPTPTGYTAYSVTATVTRGLDSVADPTSDELVLDTLATVDIAGGATAITGDPTPVISGSSSEIPPGTIITVTLDIGNDSSVDVTYATVIGADGSWSINTATAVPVAGSFPAAGLGGPVLVNASATDPAGNIGSDSQLLEVDVTPPVITLTFNGKTDDTTPLITGTTDLPPGSTITVEIDPDNDGDWSDVMTFFATVQPDGTWSVEVVPALPLGTIIGVRASGTDAVGNATTTPVKPLEITADAPSVTISPLPDGSGEIYEDGLVDAIEDDAVAFAGATAFIAPGTMVRVTVTDGSLTIQDTAIVQADGTWSIAPLNLSAMANGFITVTATVIDDFGNAVTDTYAFVHDKTAGGDVSIDAIASDTAILGDFITADNTLVFLGSATPAATVTLTLTGPGGTFTDVDVIATAGGAWSYDHTAVVLPDGTYNLKAVVGASEVNQTIVVDTTPPAGPVTVAPQATENTTPTITGTATVAVGEALSVTVNGITYIVGDGHLTLVGSDWTLVIPPEHALSPASVQSEPTFATWSATASPTRPPAS
jgi:hypothetical protein